MSQISDLMLERYQLGEVSPKERKYIEEKLTTDDALSARYQLILQMDRSLPPLKVLHAAPVVQRKLRPPLRVPRRAIVAAAASAVLVLGAGLLAYMAPGAFSGNGGTGVPGTILQEAVGDRIKGAAVESRPLLKVYGKASGESLSDGAMLGSGDTVQLSYQVAGASGAVSAGAAVYGVIYSIDGRGVTTLHYPYSSSGSTALKTGGEELLTEAYTLDDAPKEEVFYFVTSSEPLSVDSVVHAGANAGSEFPGCNVETFILIKKEQ
jgi:anti-sigma factor RsiW